MAMHSISAQLMTYGYTPQCYILHTLPILGFISSSH